MRNTFTIAWKETRTYFTTPVAYIVAMVFLAITGYFFVASLSTSFPEAVVSPYLTPSTFVMVFLAPVLTMRLMAEEQKLGTIELLFTSPVRDWEIVLGKFLASMAFFTVTLFLTLFYVILLVLFGSPDVGPIFTGYLGLLLHGTAALSVGLLASSLSSNQIVAAVVAFGVLLLLALIDQLSNAVSGMAATLVSEISLVAHFGDFSRGIIDTGDLVYYISFIAFVLFLTVRSLESRRWR